MAAPATPAAPTRDQQIAAKEKAIKDRLATANAAAKTKATTAVAADIAKMKKSKKYGTATESYDTQAILGGDKGFAKSDYGVGDGAAIPYQIGNAKASVSQTLKKPAPVKPAKPGKSAAVQRRLYTVQRGDTLSGIAKKYGTSWQDIWNYNLKNRSSSAVAKMKSRGPNLIYKGSTFYIP